MRYISWDTCVRVPVKASCRLYKEAEVIAAKSKARNSTKNQNSPPGKHFDSSEHKNLA